MRVCVIGNSHVAAVKNGYDGLKLDSDWPESVVLDFFAARNTLIQSLDVIEYPGEVGVLSPLNNTELKAAITYTSGGMDMIDFRLYDACLLIGLNRVPEMDLRTSSALMDNLLSSIALWSGTSKMVQKIRKISEIPVFALPIPMLADPARNFPESFRPLPYAHCIRQLQRHSTAQKFRYFPQPAETLLHECSTKEQFSRGSTRLDIGDRISNSKHAQTDYDHMNDLYGRAVLTELLANLSN